MPDPAPAPVFDATRDFCDYSVERLRHHFGLISKCLHLLSVEQVWHRPNDVSNAVGNLVLHLRGNVQAWIVAAVGGEAFVRDRDAEFAERGPLPTETILASLSRTVDDACRVLDSLGPDDLARPHEIGRFHVTGQTAVYHAVEHFSLHAGQIVYATKLLLGCDLSRYDEEGRLLGGIAVTGRGSRDEGLGTRV